MREKELQEKIMTLKEMCWYDDNGYIVTLIPTRYKSCTLIFSKKTKKGENVFCGNALMLKGLVKNGIYYSVAREYETETVKSFPLELEKMRDRFFEEKFIPTFNISCDKQKLKTLFLVWFGKNFTLKEFILHLIEEEDIFESAEKKLLYNKEEIQSQL